MFYIVEEFPTWVTKPQVNTWGHILCLFKIEVLGLTKSQLGNASFAHLFDLNVMHVKT